MSKPPGSLDVLRQFRVVFKSVKWHFESIEDSCHLSGAQLWALAEVVRAPGLRVSELATAMAVHQSTASNLVDRLVSMELLQKERSDSDQRVVRLRPTESGIRIVAKAPKPVEGVLPDALRRLEPDHLDQLHRLLDEVIGLMKMRDESGGGTPLSDI